MFCSVVVAIPIVYLDWGNKISVEHITEAFNEDDPVTGLGLLFLHPDNP